MLNITRPTLLFDRQKCIGNIESIIGKVKKSGVKLRPHFKTHQSHTIGKWFRERGVNCCTVSSVEMAEYFARDNWNDITIAFPINQLEVEAINQLAVKIKLNILVSTIGVLPRLLQKLKHNVGVFIDIDTGYHRTGFDPGDIKSIDHIVQEMKSSSLLTFEGFLSHAGHTYKCKKKSDIEVIFNTEIQILAGLRDRYKKQFPGLQLSVGDTPSASVMETFSGVDEIRAGNLVFYDLTQHQIGSCSLDQIAVAMACPVVATYPSRNEIIIHGGGVHFSKDFLKLDNGVSYGAVVTLKEFGWELPPTNMYVKSLSQEHGIVYAPDSVFETTQPGDILGILPVHSCLTADSMNSYLTLEGDVIEKLN